ncbi:uncharacterized protein F4822DRAFT_440679, partial [Hypoxylon trugodes]|uniref:uncharacterized protein n=1 Tax=Hypoxylon trugodes TaxID=326681 RepID=UPI00219137C9
YVYALVLLVTSKLVCALVSEGQVFSGVHDGWKREQIKQRILQMSVVIPSIKSFHENMKLFSIAIRIIRSYLLPDKPRAPLLESLKDNWKLPDKSLVEFEEGKFRAIHSPLSFDVAFKQVFLAAVRSFPELSDETPKVDPGDRIRAAIRPSTVAAFYQRAFLLGFSSEAMRERGLGNDRLRGPRYFTTQASDGPADVEATCMDRRWGRPYARIYRQIQQVAFLPLLAQKMQTATFPTVLYLQWDFVRAFLGSFTLEPGSDNQVIPLSSQRRWELERIEETEEGAAQDSILNPASPDMEQNGIELTGYCTDIVMGGGDEGDITMQDLVVEDVEMADFDHNDRVTETVFSTRQDLRSFDHQSPGIWSAVRSQVPSLDIGNPQQPDYETGSPSWSPDTSASYKTPGDHGRERHVSRQPLTYLGVNGQDGSVALISVVWETARALRTKSSIGLSVASSVTLPVEPKFSARVR